MSLIDKVKEKTRNGLVYGLIGMVGVGGGCRQVLTTGYRYKRGIPEIKIEKQREKVSSVYYIEYLERHSDKIMLGINNGQRELEIEKRSEEVPIYKEKFEVVKKPTALGYVARIVLGPPVVVIGVIAAWPIILLKSIERMFGGGLAEDDAMARKMEKERLKEAQERKNTIWSYITEEPISKKLNSTERINEEVIGKEKFYTGSRPAPNINVEISSDYPIFGNEKRKVKRTDDKGYVEFNVGNWKRGREVTIKLLGKGGENEVRKIR